MAAPTAAPRSNPAPNYPAIPGPLPEGPELTQTALPLLREGRFLPGRPPFRPALAACRQEIVSKWSADRHSVKRDHRAPACPAPFLRHWQHIGNRCPSTVRRPAPNRQSASGKRHPAARTAAPTLSPNRIDTPTPAIRRPTGRAQRRKQRLPTRNSRAT